VSQRQTVVYGVTELLVELTPDVLVGPELLVGLRGYLQPLHTRALLVNFPFRRNVSHRAVPYLGESFEAVLDE